MEVGGGVRDGAMICTQHLHTGSSERNGQQYRVGQTLVSLSRWPDYPDKNGKESGYAWEALTEHPTQQQRWTHPPYREVSSGGLGGNPVARVKDTKGACAINLQQCSKGEFLPEFYITLGNRNERSAAGEVIHGYPVLTQQWARPHVLSQGIPRDLWVAKVGYRGKYIQWHSYLFTCTKNIPWYTLCIKVYAF